MPEYISAADIYTAFQEKKLRESCQPNEKVVLIRGCPTIVKRGWAARKLLDLRGAVIVAESKA